MVRRYRERPAPPALASRVACAWTQQVPEDGYLQRIMPDGCLDLIWRDGVLEMVGPDTGPRVLPLAAGSVAGVRLRPGAAGLLLGDVPAAALRDLQVPLSELWGSRAQQVADRLAVADDADEAARLLEELAVARLPEHHQDPAVAEAIRLLSGPRAPGVPEIAQHLGWSARHFRRRFTAAVGYSPKTLHSILRFRRSIELEGPLADRALAAGYADQAHLSREVRRLSGLTAAELLTGRTPAACARHRSSPAVDPLPAELGRWGQPRVRR